MILRGPRTSVVLQTVTRSADGIGGFTESWADTATISVILNPMSPDEAKQYDKDTVIGMYNMYYEVGSQSVNEQNRIKYGARYFEVVSVLNPFQLDYFYKVILREVR